MNLVWQGRARVDITVGRAVGEDGKVLSLASITILKAVRALTTPSPCWQTEGRVRATVYPLSSTAVDLPDVPPERPVAPATFQPDSSERT